MLNAQEILKYRLNNTSFERIIESFSQNEQLLFCISFSDIFVVIFTILRWFKLEEDPDLGISSYVYQGGYWRSKCEGKFDNTPDIF